MLAMFRRPESLRERTLLRIIDRQQRQIEELTEQVMFLAGRPWRADSADRDEAALTVPREWTANAGQDPVY
jgi:hypothetical protein